MPSSIFGTFGFAGALFLFFGSGSGKGESFSVSPEGDVRCVFVVSQESRGPWVYRNVYIPFSMMGMRAADIEIWALLSPS